jgi:hypothetical protein
MKMDRIDIGSGCSVGTDSVVLYGSHMEPKSVLGDLSLLMKGEMLPEGTRWEGSPARPSQPMSASVTEPKTPPSIRRGDVQLILGTASTSTKMSTSSETGLFFLEPDVHGRPRAQDGQGRNLAVSQARTPGARILAIAQDGRIGVDLEQLRPSQALEAASELFLPTERHWVESLPEAGRWRTLLALWTAKEAVLKALGQGFSFGMNQIELEPDGAGIIALRRLCGSERLAQGWTIELQERSLEGRDYLVALARNCPHLEAREFSAPGGLDL